MSGVGDEAVGDVDAAVGVGSDEIGQRQARRFGHAVFRDEGVTGFGRESAKAAGSGFQPKPAIADRARNPDVVAWLCAGAAHRAARADLAQ
jgi:hypothetical protein